MHNDGIQKGLEQKKKHHEIARKIFIQYPTFAFEGDSEIEFELKNSICDHFDLPYSSVQIVGSAKTGYSYFKTRKFVKGQSDLDIAIVNTELFRFYCEVVAFQTNNFRKLTGFTKTVDKDNYAAYQKYITKGYFRPDLMPSCDAKRDWFNFFNKLSQEFSSWFSQINAGIYLSEALFELKQSGTIDAYKKQ